MSFGVVTLRSMFGPPAATPGTRGNIPTTLIASDFPLRRFLLLLLSISSSVSNQCLGIVKEGCGGGAVERKRGTPGLTGS